MKFGMSYEEALEAAAENIADGGGSIGEHVDLLTRQYGVTVAQATHDLGTVIMGAEA